MKTALILLTEIAGLIAAFIIFLLVLNFFNIISLSKIYPRQFGWLPQIAQTVTYDQITGFWTTKGTFYQYNDEKIKVKTGPFKIMDFVYTTASLGYFYKSQSDIDNPAGAPPTLYTLYDIENTKNLGMHAQVEYKIANDANTISRIILYR